jgi:hypothetical protein
MPADYFAIYDMSVQAHGVPAAVLGVFKNETREALREVVNAALEEAAKVADERSAEAIRALKFGYYPRLASTDVPPAASRSELP